MIKDLTCFQDEILQRKQWIFDMDGTLTVPVHDFDEIRRILGVPVGGDILKYLSDLPEEKARVLREKLDKIEVEFARQALPMDHIRAFLKMLDQNGVRMGILTRNNRKNTLTTLQEIGIKSYFNTNCIIGRDDARPKPDPEGILKLLAIWNTVPAEAVMVGDFLYDLQCGRNAGTATIHFDQSGNFPWPEQTDIKVTSFVELVESYATISKN